MALYTVEYDYVVPEFGSITLDIPEDQMDTAETFVQKELLQMFPDIEDIEIISMKRLED